MCREYVAATTTQAARLVEQTSFGPTVAIQYVKSVGVDGYLAEQFSALTTRLATIPTNLLTALCQANNTARVCA